MKIESNLIENGFELSGRPFRLGSKQEAVRIGITVHRSPSTGRRNTRVQFEGWDATKSVTIVEIEILMAAIRQIVDQATKMLLAKSK